MRSDSLISAVFWSMPAIFQTLQSQLTNAVVLRILIGPSGTWLKLRQWEIIYSTVGGCPSGVSEETPGGRRNRQGIWVEEKITTLLTSHAVFAVKGSLKLNSALLEEGDVMLCAPDKFLF